MEPAINGTSQVKLHLDMKREVSADVGTLKQNMLKASLQKYKHNLYE